MTRVALITGAASGIGRACAAKLAQVDIKVAIVDTQEDKGQQAAHQLQGYFIKADLTQPADCRRAVEKTVEQYGQLDILINNAGFQHIDPVADFPEETWDKMIALMLSAPFY